MQFDLAHLGQDFAGSGAEGVVLVFGVGVGGHAYDGEIESRHGVHDETAAELRRLRRANPDSSVLGGLDHVPVRQEQQVGRFVPLGFLRKPAIRHAEPRTHPLVPA